MCIRDSALFAPDAQSAQRSAEARDMVGELAIGQRAARVDIGRLVGAAGCEVALQHVGGEIVIAWDRAHGFATRVCRTCFGGCHCFSSPDSPYYAGAGETPQCRSKGAIAHDLQPGPHSDHPCCLLYTSDAADEEDSVDL